MNITLSKDSQGWYYNINGIQSVINLSTKTKAKAAADIAIKKGRMWTRNGFVNLKKDGI
jgi:hypothetical protein